jgi:hypothetical protein
LSVSDQWGNALSNADAKTAQGFDRAALMLAAYQIDPVAVIDQVLQERPDFAMGHALRAGMLATATDKAFEPELRRSVEAGEALMGSVTARERAHIGAGRAWLDGDLERATAIWGRIAIDHPRDLPALQFAHLGDFFQGASQMLRDRIARARPSWTSDMPGHGFVLGMQAFGLEEAGEYAPAEAIGREATAINRQDGWAVHAVTHVLEMQGRADDGAGWLTETASGWAPGSGFAFHNWWHLALFQIERGNIDAVLELHDTKIAAGGFAQALELVDGSALLWRLHALGRDLGDRWQILADKWAERVDHAYYAFNDLHAMAAFIGAGRRDLQAQALANVARAAQGSGTNAMMSREIGLPAMHGFAAFGRGAYGEACDTLLPLRAKANRFGGSHAQRDIFSWTLLEAAIRGGDRALADALSNERLAAKPHSPVNRAWAARARNLPAAKPT